MAADDLLKRVGVKELEKTSSGREYMGKLRKHYEKELLQPGDPRFNQVYGAEIKQKERDMERLREQSRAEKGALEERKARKVKELSGSLPSQVLIQWIRAVPPGACERCLQPLEEGEHGWYICPLEPR